MYRHVHVAVSWDQVNETTVHLQATLFERLERCEAQILGRALGLGARRAILVALLVEDLDKILVGIEVVAVSLASIARLEARLADQVTEADDATRLGVGSAAVERRADFVSGGAHLQAGLADEMAEANDARVGVSLWLGSRESRALGLEAWLANKMAEADDAGLSVGGRLWLTGLQTWLTDQVAEANDPRVWVGRGLALRDSLSFTGLETWLADEMAEADNTSWLRFSGGIGVSDGRSESLSAALSLLAFATLLVALLEIGAVDNVGIGEMGAGLVGSVLDVGARLARLVAVALKQRWILLDGVADLAVGVGRGGSGNSEDAGHDESGNLHVVVVEKSELT